MQKNLLDFLVSVSTCDEQVEVLREVLCERAEYNIYLLFQDLDKARKGFIDLVDLKEIFSGVRDFEINSLIEIWTNGDRKVKYQEFLYWVLPWNKFPKPMSEIGKVTSGAKYSIRRFFEKEIEFQRRFEKFVRDFMESSQGRFEKAFELMDVDGVGVSKENITEFFMRNSERISMASLNGLFKRLDRDADGVISYQDFMKIFMGPQPYCRLGSSKSEIKLKFQYKDSLKENQLYTKQKGVKKQTIPSTQLKKLLNGLIHFEKSIELNRNALALRIDFTIETAFKLFDKKRKKTVSELDFQSGLADLGIKTTANVIFLIYRHYDTNNDGHLAFADFSAILMPKMPTYAGLIALREKKSQVSLETKQYISDTFKTLIDLEINAEILRRDLNFTKFSLQELFEHISSTGAGYLSVKEFRNILLKNKIQPTNRELFGIIERFDINRDGKISFAEFVQEVLPRSPSSFIP